jgi:uncharacterized protein
VNTNLTAEAVIELLNLKPLPIEGGYFSETYKSAETLSMPPYPNARPLATAIYFLLTPDTFSEMHRLPGAEIYHFYLGDAVELLQLEPDARSEMIVLGSDIGNGMKVQHVVHGGCWQGSRLRAGGKFALLGTTMAPGFDFADYESGKRERLEKGWPERKEMISELCRK